MATVTLNGVTYDDAALADGGHRHPTVGFFAILQAMIAELAAADTVNGLSPGAARRGIFSDGAGAWVARLAEFADVSDASTVLAAVQAVAALGSAQQGLRVNAAGTGLEFVNGGTVKLAETELALAAASITFASIPASYKHLRVVLSARGDDASTFQVLRMRLNGSSSAVYDWLAGSTSGGFTGAGETSARVGLIACASADANRFGKSTIDLRDYTDTAKMPGWQYIAGTRWSTTAADVANEHGNGDFRTTGAAVSSIQLYLAAGNFAAGTVATLYGHV